MTPTPETGPPSEGTEGHDPTAPTPVGRPSEGITVGFVPGVMPGKWFDRWDERFARNTPLTRLPLESGGGLEGLAAGHAHMVLARPDDEPDLLDRERFHAVSLYEEQMVVVLPMDHVLTLFDEVPVEELSAEFMLQPPESVPEWASVSQEARAANPRKLPQMRDTADAVELVAAGLGLLIAPMSIARYHHRKDLTYRPVEAVATRSVALVWPRDPARDEADEAILQEFVGVARGRKSSSSRGAVARQESSAGTRNARRPAPVRGKPGRASSTSKKGQATSPKNRATKNRRAPTRGKKR